MKKNITNALSLDLNKQEALRLISVILNSYTVSSLKANIETFLHYIESKDDIHKWMIRNRFYNSIKERDIIYQYKISSTQYNDSPT